MMLSVGDIERARAVSLAELVGGDVPLKKVGKELCGRCPFHGEKTASFYVIPDKGFFHCFGCGAHGTAIDYVMRSKHVGFAAAVRELIHSSEHLTTRPQVRPAAISLPDERETDPLVLDLWRSANAPRLVDHYLYSRGLTAGRAQAALRGHYSVWCSESRRHRPAVLAAVQDSSGEICAVQRIWVEPRCEADGSGLPPKGARSRDLAAGKKTLGKLRDGAVRLFNSARSMGLAEGVETALAAAEIFCVPVWAAAGGARMGAVWLPGECLRLTIFGDNGSAGRELAARAVETHRARGGITVSAEFPPEHWGDWNDALRA